MSRNLSCGPAFTFAITAMVEEANWMSEEALVQGRDEDDEQVAHAISKRFQQDRALGGVQIHVNTNEATLTGDVESQEARDRAEEIATGVPGVRFVINNLRVAQEGTTGATG
ncbi:MAG: BON domain-containing protein [Geminicoccaceae bacterium]